MGPPDHRRLPRARRQAARSTARVAPRCGQGVTEHASQNVQRVVAPVVAKVPIGDATSRQNCTADLALCRSVLTVRQASGARFRAIGAGCRYCWRAHALVRLAREVRSSKGLASDMPPGAYGRRAESDAPPLSSPPRLPRWKRHVSGHSRGRAPPQCVAPQLAVDGRRPDPRRRRRATHRAPRQAARSPSHLSASSTLARSSVTARRCRGSSLVRSRSLSSCPRARISSR